MERAQLRLALEQAAPGAYALAVQLLGSREDAADALQDAVVRAFGSDAYDPAQGTFKAWFLAVVRNRCLDLLRQRQRRPLVEFDETAFAAVDADPETLFARGERASKVAMELAGLPAEQREILILREYLDLSYAEIARVLSVPAGTVMSRLHRARSALADRLRRRDDERP